MGEKPSYMYFMFCIYMYIRLHLHINACVFVFLFSASEVAAIHLSHISAATVSGKVIMVIFLVVFSNNVPN